MKELTPTKTNFKKRIRLTLKFALIRSGITQAQVARRLRVSPATVSRIVCGHAKPRRGDRRKIARALGLPVRNLFPEIRRRKGTPA